MTATMVDDIVDVEIVGDVEQAAVCEAQYEDGRLCENEADFVCAVSCCGAIILLCEDCFYMFREYAKKYYRMHAECMRCGNDIIIRPQHLMFVKRVRD